jgi:hypothetical protein
MSARNAAPVVLLLLAGLVVQPQQGQPGPTQAEFNDGLLEYGGLHGASDGHLRSHQDHGGIRSTGDPAG